MISVDDMLRRASSICNGPQSAKPLDMARAIVDVAASRVPDEPSATSRGGIDREGRDFITIYYGVEEH